ncbi:MAG: SDR family oxidoreductase [Gammaproteobacteria bacterium]|nr:SDR family oxidoreductase [Gammaproteobacteria bacterium]
MKIVITGASGQYGRSATDKLIAKGLAKDLVLISRTPTKLADRAAQGCDVRYGDFDKPETLAAAMAGAQKMLLISGTRVGARVVQHKAAIDAAAAGGVKHIVYTSFVGIHPDNPAVVTRDHSATEDLIMASGCSWTMMRDAHYADAMIVMAGPNFIRSGQWLTSSAGGREAMVWREDCVDSAVAVLTGTGHENKIYNITGPDLQTFEEVAELITSITGRKVEVVQTSDEGMYAMWDAMGIPRKPVDDQYVKGIPWNSEDMVTFEASIREGWLEVATDDVEKLTGHKARSVRQMIEENAQMLRSV